MWRCFTTALKHSYPYSESVLGSDTTHTQEHLPSLWVDSSKTFQTLEGFGGAFTESAAKTWLALPQAAQARVLEHYFSASHGHGYTLCRVHMGSCDFSMGHYSHVSAAEPVDAALTNFDLSRDEDALIPFIKAAQAVASQPLALMVSPWSPPSWMKTNAQMNQGGKLKPEFRQAWANYFVKFVQAYEAHGITVWGVSVQNEPMAVQRWDSCIYDAHEERDFVRDYLGPTLAQVGLSHVRIVCWDHNRDAMVERASVLYADEKASSYIDHVQLVHDAWPDKHLLFTEGCQEGGPHLGEWAVGERYAHNIIHDLNHWTVGWIDWNLLLDTQGGPNHVGNYCSAPILADLPRGALCIQSAYYYIGHFAKFIRPGAKRLLCAATEEAIECTAWRNVDGSTVVVALNRSPRDIAFSLKTIGGSYHALLISRSISTFIDTAPLC
jgi:glucosylceramidase